MKTKNIKTILKIFVLAALLAGCKKKDEDTPAPAPAPTAPATSTYYIEGKVNGVMHHADYICPNTGCDMVNGNYDAFMTTIAMMRTTSSSDPVGWSIHISDVDLDNWQIPDTLDGTWFTGFEHLDLSYYSGTWDSDHNFLVDVVILGDPSFEMIVTSKTGDIIEGTFHGTLRNGTTSTNHVSVTEGKFRIKLVRI